jgi:cell division septation protein DedD
MAPPLNQMHFSTDTDAAMPSPGAYAWARVGVFGALVCAFYAVCPAASSPAASAISALPASGDDEGARRAAETANAENPADPGNALLYAKTMSDGSRALELYKKIAADTALPDSLRAEANFRLGCAFFMKGRYHKAGQCLKKTAEGPNTNADATIARFLIAIHDTADTAGFAALTAQAADTSLYVGKMACYFLGLRYLAKKQFASSLPFFNMAAGACGDSMWWSCGAFAGAYSCAVALGRREESISVLRHMKRVFPSCLEKNQLAKMKPSPVSSAPKDLRPRVLPADTTAWLGRDSVAKRDIPVKKETPGSAARPLAARANFFLQVGAFGSADNAGSLKSDLGKRYSPVSVVIAVVGDKTIYRVRVGAFDSRESAQAFGDSALTKKGLKFRIVEDMPVE